MRQRSTIGRHARSGFTLIELLVVIAIIAILAAILFPVFAQARKRARLTVCISNNKQMGTAMLMYAQDYDETMALWISPPSGTPGGDAVLRNNYGFLSLQPYIKNTALYDDPECLQWDETGGTKYTPNPALPNDVPVDYRFNLNGVEGARMANNPIRNGTTIVGTFSLTLASCPNPAQFFMISDRHTQHHIDGGLFVSGNSPRYIMPMVFADGHAKFVRPYAASDRDSKNQIKAYHWNFPSCHPVDAQVAGEYGG